MLRNHGTLTLGLSLLIAFVAFSVTFSGAAPLNFWFLMLTGTFVLGSIGLAEESRNMGWGRLRHWEDWLIGIVAAVALYGVFFIGHRVSGIIFPAEGQQVASIYQSRGLLPTWAIALLLIPIGGMEEVYWRGYAQNFLARTRLGPFGAMILGAVFYAAVHIVSLNPMLLLAALVCGLFWGLLFLWRGSIVPGLISHILWDVAIFVLWPVA